MCILYYLENHSKQGKMKKRPKVSVSKGNEKKKTVEQNFWKKSTLWHYKYLF